MTDKPLQQRAGRNIGIESLAVFRQAAGAPEVVATIGADIDASPGPQVTVMEGVEKALRTPTMTAAVGTGPFSGWAFNSETVTLPQLKFYFQDELGNKMLIANISSPLGGGPLDLAVTPPSTPNPFTLFKPLCLCEDEKIVMRAGYPTPPPVP